MLANISNLPEVQFTKCSNGWRGLCARRPALLSKSGQRSSSTEPTAPGWFFSDTIYRAIRNLKHRYLTENVSISLDLIQMHVSLVFCISVQISFLLLFFHLREVQHSLCRNFLALENQTPKGECHG